MNKSWRRAGLALALACAGCIGIGISSHPSAARADNSSPTTKPAVDQIESLAFAALKQGNFQRSSQLLDQAAAIAPADSVAQMAHWADDFQQQEDSFAAERKKLFDKYVIDIHTLVDHGMRVYAIDAVQQAYLRAADKKAFRNEAWIDALVKEAGATAEKDQAEEHWLEALRIYSDLTSVDPAVPEWKDRLKAVSQHLRLLMIYAPDAMAALQKAEVKPRQEADALLSPTTKPAMAMAGAATMPTTLASEDDGADIKMDWHDTVRGATMDMLIDSIIYAERDYYRQVSLQDLLNGGLTGLKALATTQGLEKAFPALEDAANRDHFNEAIATNLDKVKSINKDNEEAVFRDVLTSMIEANARTIKLPTEVFVTEFSNGSFNELDPFSNVIWPADVEEFNKTTQGEFSGVGIQIQKDDTTGGLRVVSPLEDSPAYRAGIKAGDTIVKIDGKSAKRISIEMAVKTITGKAGTSVVLTIKSPDGIVKDFSIQRQQINVASVKGYQLAPGGGWDYLVDPGNKIAYVRLSSFTRKSPAEMNDALKGLKKQGAKAIILDLRYNPGGLLPSAVSIASNFIRQGVIVSTHPDRETENQPTVNDATPDENTTDLPLAVLTNQLSASASEIVSGALKDHGRATIVGERTFGKGSVQMLFAMADRAALLKLTTSHYYLPSGRCLHREENSTVWGVDPDVNIEMTPEEMRKWIDARQSSDVLYKREAPSTMPTTQPDLLAVDPQLSAALLVLRLKLAGAQL